jgi:hypothetical protein
MVVLVGGGARLPPDAKKVALGSFDPIDEPRIDSAKQVDPLEEDLALGAAEVWCVNFTFLCWGPPYTFVEKSTCSDSRLIRRIGDEWQVSLVVTDEDKANWEARGCELTLDPVAMP